MRYSLIALLLGMSMIWGMSAHAAPIELPRCQNPYGPLKGGSDPWPWGSPTPFPWKDINGVWVAKINGCSRYFSFKVLRNESSGGRILSILEIDPYTCMIVSKGAGSEENRIVRAVITGKYGQSELFIQMVKATSNSKSNKSHGRVSDEESLVTVMTMNPVGQPKRKKSSSLIKIGDEPSIACE